MSAAGGRALRSFDKKMWWILIFNKLYIFIITAFYHHLSSPKTGSEYLTCRLTTGRVGTEFVPSFVLRSVCGVAVHDICSVSHQWGVESPNRHHTVVCFDCGFIQISSIGRTVLNLDHRRWWLQTWQSFSCPSLEMTLWSIQATGNNPIGTKISEQHTVIGDWTCWPSVISRYQTRWPLCFGARSRWMVSKILIPQISGSLRRPKKTIFQRGLE